MSGCVYWISLCPKASQVNSLKCFAGTSWDSINQFFLDYIQCSGRHKCKREFGQLMLAVAREPLSMYLEVSLSLSVSPPLSLLSLPLAF